MSGQELYESGNPKRPWMAVPQREKVLWERKAQALGSTHRFPSAPTTEQVREARERLKRYAEWLGSDEDSYDPTPDWYSFAQLAADIRTVLDALDAKDEQEKNLLRAVLAEGTVAAERIISRGRPAPSAPAESFEKCPVSGDFVFTAVPQTEAEPPCADCGHHKIFHEERTASCKPGALCLCKQYRAAASPVSSVTPSVTDEDVERARKILFEDLAYNGWTDLFRRVLEDFASRKGAEK